MSTRTLIFGVALFSGLAAIVPTAQAGIIQPGSVLIFSGAGNLGITSLSFQCNQPGDTQCVVAPSGSGDFSVSNSTGNFAQYNLTFGLIKSLNNAGQPLNTAFSLPSWISFDLNSQIGLELTFLPLGTDPQSANCAGLTVCTPTSNLLITPNNPGGLTGFDLTQTGSNTAATFFVGGIAHATDGTFDSFSGIFTTQFAGLNPQQTLAALATGNPQSYSAVITLAGSSVPVPEPLTLSMFAVGLVGAAAIRRHKGKKA